MTTVVTPDILLPTGVDLQKWATVACDQFTSEPQYWNKLAAFVGQSPSALNITFPEIFLKQDIDQRTQRINQTMRNYLDSGMFRALHGFVLVEREVEQGKNRIGLLAAVDLDKYDWNRVKTDIRATEDTIPDRLPVRVKIRQNAVLELPHILLLIDDPKRSVIEPIYQNRDQLELLYDFNLNMGGGRIRGYFVADTAPIIQKIEAFTNPQRQTEMYGQDAGLKIAVGDGNHSLATAKVHWENLKKTLSPTQAATHPARYALAEIVNLYDEAMVFEPIHRVAIGNTNQVVSALKSGLSGSGMLKIETVDGVQTIAAPSDPGKQIAEIERILTAQKEAGAEIDYIHGDKHLQEVVQATGGVGIYCPYFPKEDILPYVIKVGNLPKKAFSIGGAEFKKYYLEARKIVK